jgi:V-type H+-transporting ATPase subunit A
MLGLGVRRLKARPSLLDLIANRGVGDLSSSARSQKPPSSPPRPGDLPPLPVSPTTSIDSTGSSSPNIPPPLLITPSVQTPVSHIMASSGKGPESSEDAHHGTVFSISGPVVVAENMLGCAMYELVCISRAFRLLLLAPTLRICIRCTRPLYLPCIMDI